MTTPLVALSLVLMSVPGASAPRSGVSATAATVVPPVTRELPGYPPRVRIWLASTRDYYRHGDRLRVLFSTTADAYVAVIHIDPDGYLEFLYPNGPWDDEYVRGGRVYSLPIRGTGAGMLVRAGRGVGYFYIIASPVPLDYRYFRGPSGLGWSWSYGGRYVHGDPFYALDELTRALLPGGYIPYSVDYSTYYVGGIVPYPSYACGAWTGGGGFGWGIGSYFGPCNRLEQFLRRNPYYFDSRRYRGNREAFFRGYRAAERAHGYKEPPAQTPRTAQPRRDAETRERDQARYVPQAPTLERRRPAPPAERAPEPAPARGVTSRRPDPAPAAPRSARPAPQPSRGGPAVGTSSSSRGRGNAPASGSSRRARPAD